MTTCACTAMSRTETGRGENIEQKKGIKEGENEREKKQGEKRTSQRKRT